MNCARPAIAGVTMLLASTVAALSQGTSLTLSSGFPPIAVPPVAHQAVADWLAENSDIDVQVYSMTLLNLQETSAGIRDGIADMGYVLTPYHPAEFAEANLAADMSMLATTGEGSKAPGLVMAAAITEYVMLECSECQDEYTEQNQLFLAGGSSTEYSLVCKAEVNSVEDVRGKTIRVGAPVFGRWVENFGGTQASFPGSEMFEALSQGVIDCTMVGTPDVVNFQLLDVVTNIKVGVPGGVFAGAGSMNLNLDRWREMSEEQRATMLQAGALGTAEVAVGYLRQAIDAEAKIKEAGVAMEPASEAFATATADFLEKDLATIEEQFTSVFGVERVSEKMATIQELVKKWKEKVDGLADPADSDAYRQLLWDEIYAKVDASTYGMI
jgi:TRAP-type C4-dicarboxylate transport system substrate-binding protein